MGTWLTVDPRRLTLILTLLITFATVAALGFGLTHLGTLVGPNGTGDSGGG